MKLYGACLSPYVRKVAFVLNMKGLECERDDALPGTLSREISPLGKIPVLIDGAMVLPDSSVICEYLEEQYPSIAVLPKAVADRAKSRWLEEFSDSKLGELCGSKLFSERVAKKIMRGEDADEKVVADAIDNLLPPVQDYLEHQLPQDGFVFGQPGIVDIGIATHFITAGYAGYEVDALRWPRLAAHVKRLSAMPEVQQQLKAEAALLARLKGASGR